MIVFRARPVFDSESIAADLRSFAAKNNFQWKNQADVIGTSALPY